MKKIFKYIAFFILLAYLITAIIWTNEKATERVCTGVSVDIIKTDSLIFLSEDGILKELETLKIHPVGRRLNLIKTDEIEETLNQYDYLEDAQCIITSKGKMIIQVTQMSPVMRVYVNGKSYYINHQGKKMKADSRYHIDVPIVYGNFRDSSFSVNEFIPLAEYIAANPVINDLVTAIKVNDKNNIIIVPAFYGHVVNFGSLDNYKSKFDKLLLMYQKVMPHKGWLAYDTISVKWDYQIVGNRRNAKKFKDYSKEPDFDEEAPDLDMINLDISKKEVVASN